MTTRTITLRAPAAARVQPRDPRLVSYNIEMTEVTGGTFWRRYTPAQIAGADEVPAPRLPAGMDGGSFSMSDMLGGASALMEERPPIDLSQPRLRTLAAAIGPSWVRVSGSWATGTYFDYDGRAGDVPPEGYRAVLTRAQWEGVLDFVRVVGGRLLVSFAVIPGLENAACKKLGGTGAWDPSQVRRLLNAATRYGVPVSAVEFANEPNISFLDARGYAPKGYMQDQDAFYRFMRVEFPGVRLVGPCGAMDPIDEADASAAATGDDMSAAGNGAGAVADSAPAEGMLSKLGVATSRELAALARERPDAYSYHIYAGMSERGAAFGHHWNPDEAASDAVLDVADCARCYHEPIRDAWCPKAPLWVTESGDANCGGNTWGSTFLDVFRTADEIARFSAAGDGVIFHNTLASSDYGLLDEATFAPRPNWWFLWLWKRLMGNGAFPVGDATVEPLALPCAHAYARTRGDGRPGTAYLVINNSLDEGLDVVLPAPAARYTLSSAAAPADGPVTTLQLRCGTMLLNGHALAIADRGAMPALGLMGVDAPAGAICLPPATVSFLVL